MNQSKIYGRVEGDKIVEYPVLALHIKNRAHPFEWYTECIIEPKPEVPDFHTLKEVVRLIEGRIYVGYTIVPVELRILLRQAAGSPPPRFANPEAPVAERTIADVPQDLLKRIIEMIDDYCEKKLEDFAKSRSFKSIDSLVSYKFSNDTTWAAQALHAINIRDTTWKNLIQYQNEVLAGTKPIPAKIEDIEAVLPAYTWPEGL